MSFHKQRFVYEREWAGDERVCGWWRAIGRTPAKTTTTTSHMCFLRAHVIIPLGGTHIFSPGAHTAHTHTHVFSCLSNVFTFFFFTSRSPLPSCTICLSHIIVIVNIFYIVHYNCVCKRASTHITVYLVHGIGCTPSSSDSDDGVRDM